MCGRYTLAAAEEELIEAFELPGLTFDYFARYNIAPGQQAPVVAEDSRGRRMGLMEWGFLPSWKEEASRAFINARSETVASKASFREAFARRRCLVPADGFYEWEKRGGRRVPFWIHPPAGGVISFAGVWESWRAAGVTPKHTFAILTTDANREVSAIHDRMPVIVSPQHRKRWLDRATSGRALTDVLAPAPDGTLALREVSNRVNRPDYDDEGLVDPV